MSGFTKLVPEIIQSSIWNEPSDVRIVWITMLAIKDAEGYVRGDASTIARLANVPQEAALAALDLFQQPDPSSCTPDNEGRRIQAAPGGWVVLNHHLYRTGDRNEYMRDYMRNYRKKKDVNSVNVNVSLPSASVSASASASDAIIEAFEKAWSAYGKYGVKKKALEYWKSLKPEDRVQVENAIPVYIQCVAAGRAKSQFEGWINPKNRKWDVDWVAALSQVAPDSKPVRVKKESNPDILNYAEDYKRMLKDQQAEHDQCDSRESLNEHARKCEAAEQRFFVTVRDNCPNNGIKRVKEAAK